MSFEMSMGTGPKQFGIGNKPPKPKIDTGKLPDQQEGSKGLTKEDVAEISNVTDTDKFKANETKDKLLDQSNDNLKKSYEKSLMEGHDNAHNMLLEIYNKEFKAPMLSAILRMKGVPQEEIAQINQHARETAKDNVMTGAKNAAKAFVEFDVYT